MTEFITDRNEQLNLTVLEEWININDFKKDDEIFFKSGQLLMFLYVFSVINLPKENIKYLDGTFFLKLSKDNFCNQLCIKADSKSIAYDIINKSIYTKFCFQNNFNIESSLMYKNLNDFKRGFKICYETFLSEKINIMRFLENKGLENICLNFIRNLKMLTPRDLKIQLHFINIKARKAFVPNSMIEKVLLIKNDKAEFISLSTKLLDLVNENSLIGINNDGKLETTWIKCIDEKLCPIGIESIYIAAYFSYISKATNNSYYSQSAKSSLMPLFHLCESDYKNIMNDNKILSSIYLLNEYIDCSELSNFVEYNPKLFMTISNSYKKDCILNADNLIFQCIIDNSLDVLKSIILV